jgi:hypothetical protein
MKLEVGKYYKTRGGGKVRVAGRREFAADNYPFLVESTSGNYYSVSEDGRFNDGYTDSFDLIEEWRDPVTHTTFVAFYKSPGSDYICRMCYESEDGARGSIERCNYIFLGGQEVSITI